MRTKFIYCAPVSLVDSLDEPVKDSRVYSAIAGLSYVDGTVLEHLNTELRGQSDFRGGYLRLIHNGKVLEVSIEIDSPVKLEELELLDGPLMARYQTVSEREPLTFSRLPHNYLSRHSQN